MFANILGKKKKGEESAEDAVITERISKMNLSDMKVYVKNQINDFGVCPEGIVEVLKRLTSKNDKGDRFIETDANESKLKKAFELVVLIGSTKHVTMASVELATEFLKMYDDIIKQYDRDHKEIYASRIKESIENSLNTVSVMANVNDKMNALS